MTTLIGGQVCKQQLASRLMHADPRQLTGAEIQGLWRIFVAIGENWKNTVHHSAGLKSSWLEFVTQKSTIRPSYVAEYVSALEVVDELVAMYGADAFSNLFFRNGIPENSLGTRLAHAKHFVVDEFIRVQITAGGFKDFVPGQTSGKQEASEVTNYNGFIAGSRFNRIKPVRTYKRTRR